MNCLQILLLISSKFETISINLLKIRNKIYKWFLSQIYFSHSCVLKVKTSCLNLTYNLLNWNLNNWYQMYLGSSWKTFRGTFLWYLWNWLLEVWTFDGHEGANKISKCKERSFGHFCIWIVSLIYCHSKKKKKKKKKNCLRPCCNL